MQMNPQITIGTLTDGNREGHVTLHQSRGACRRAESSEDERMRQPDTDDLALWYALNRLIINYWADVDDDGGASAHDFYLPDALYVVGENRFEGEENIRAFYARRRERGNATTRHLISNLRAFSDGAHHARMIGVMSLFQGEGRPPINEASPLAMIADFEARFVQIDGHSWRFQSHVLTPIFVGRDRPFSVTIDPERLRPQGE
jgi:hypothetical protein